MRLLDRVKVLFTGQLPERKQDAVGSTVTVLPGQPRFPTANFGQFAEGGYKKNELVYSCIQEIATSAPEAPLRVYDGEDQVLDGHPLRQLFRRPNQFMTEFELWELSLVYLHLSGNIFWEKVRSRAGRVVELWPLRPDRVRIVPDEDDFIAGYQYLVGGKTFPLDARDVVHFKLPNPTDPYFGLAPLQAALRSAATDNEATDFTKVLLENRAVPGVVIKVQERIDEELADRLTEKWRQKFGGNRRGDPAFLQAGMDVETVGLDLNQLAFPDLRNVSESRICMVFGVPPILVGANVGLQRSTFANYGEARLSFWQETIGPLQRRLADKINQDLLPEFEDDGEVEARFDTSNVSALADVFNERWERADQAVANGWITVNDARAQAGLDPVEGGDVFLRRLNVVTVGAQFAEPERPETGAEGPDQSAQAPQFTLSVDQVEKLCPSCAKRLRQKGLSALKIGSGKQMPPHLLEALCARFGPEDGFFTRCVNADLDFLEGEPERFCAWLHFQCFGKWPGERGSGGPKGIKQPTDEQKIEAALQRLRVADAFEEIVREWARSEMREQKRDVLRVFDAMPKQLSPEQVDFLLRRIDALSPRWRARMQETFQPAATEMVGMAAELAADEVGFEVGDDIIAPGAHEHAAKVAASIDETSRAEIRAQVERTRDEGLSRAETRAELSERLDGWETERSGLISRTETIRAVNRGARLTYIEAGITRFVWRIADQDACPYCEAMDGTEIGAGEAFLGAGASFQPEGASSPFVARFGAVETPPLHPNCRCVITPGGF